MANRTTVNNLMGENGGTYITGTGATNGNFQAYQALTATVIASMTSARISGTLTSISVPAGSIIYGHFTSITLTSGTGIAYNAIPA